jgi:hypothetical protein
MTILCILIQHEKRKVSVLRMAKMRNYTVVFVSFMLNYEIIIYLNGYIKQTPNLKSFNDYFKLIFISFHFFKLRNLFVAKKNGLFG